MRTKHAVVLMAGLAALPASIGLATSSASAAPAPGLTASVTVFSGNAFGTFAEVGNKAISGKSASITLCTTKAGVDKASNVIGVDVPGLLSTGAVNTAASSRAPQSGPVSRASANVENARLLSGLITATSIRAISETSHDSTGFQVNGSGSFTDLSVNGQSIESSPAPNTTIRIPGVGRVVLNEQMSDIGANTASLTVNALHLYVTQDIPGVAKGTRVILGHATSSLGVDLAGSLDGMAYGTQVFDNFGVSSGPSARVVLGCSGTDGKLKTNTAAGVNVPGVITTGAITDTARGTITTDSAVAETTSTTQTTNLLGGLVTADSIKADAHATKSGGTIKLSGAGSNFSNLVVDGSVISGDVKPNTRIEVGNVTVWLHRVIRHDNSIEIRMVEIVVHGTNAAGLVDGTHIRVAVAEASAH